MVQAERSRPSATVTHRSVAGDRQAESATHKSSPRKANQSPSSSVVTAPSNRVHGIAANGSADSQPASDREPLPSLEFTPLAPYSRTTTAPRRALEPRSSQASPDVADSSPAETFLPQLSAPWISQTDTPATEELPEPAAPDNVDGGNGANGTETPADAEPPEPVFPATAEETDTDEPEETFPPAATPEQDWSNGAVLVNGGLLPPTQPTNRPPIPLNLTADYQEFEPLDQTLIARGNVVLRLGSGVLTADRLWANLANRFVLVEGNVVFTRGEQTVRADRGEYNLIQGAGSLFDARGVLFLPGVGTDFADIDRNNPTVSPGVLENDPIAGVRSTGNISFGTSLEADTIGGPTTPDAGGFVRRIRFQAARLDFDAEGWYAQDIRLTNDPFSPPELEFRGDSARLTRLTEFQDELLVENARAVFDQGFSVPLLRDRVLLSRGGPDNANPFFVNLGYDGEDRDGLFVERSFRVASAGPWSFFVTPQVLVQRFALEGDDNDSFLSNFGLEADLTGALGPTTAVDANASFSGLDLTNIDDRLRASVRVRQALGTHSLNLEYSYRDRLFNGSLGFQDVRSSLGLVLLSPAITLGDTGIVLTYQASAQYITADSDRPDLIDDPPPFEQLVDLGRFQGSVALARAWTLWQGQPLPPTPDAGLRFTPTPRVPNVALVLSGRGTYTYYTSEDTQQELSARVGIVGELGNFSRDYLDSTVFNLAYQRSFGDDVGDSPFLFDRNVDQSVLTGGIIQQIYGPFRLGFQTSINLETGEVINTDYLLEYNRRTYGVFVRFNPTQSSGFIGFRLNEFDWSGRAPRFGGANIQQVEGGVIQ